MAKGEKNGNGKKVGGAREGAGRPPIDLTDDQLRQLDVLAKIYCTVEEIAAVLGVSADTLSAPRHPEYAERIEKGRREGKSSLRRAQFTSALKGNPALLIWLGKNLLDQKDRTETWVGDLSKMTDDELDDLAKQARSRKT